MKLEYQPIISDICEKCLLKNCYVGCMKLKERLDRSWFDTYQRKPRYEVVQGRLERIN